MAKIAVATQQGGLEDQVSQVFGRCQTYTIVETDGNEIQGSEVVQNQYANATSGAGIQAAGLVANQGAEAVIAGNFGPNVVSVLNQSGVKLVQSSGMTVRDAVQGYLDGELQPVSQATAPAMSGSGGGMGRGMGRRMASQQPGQQPTGSPSGGTPQGPSTQGAQKSGEDRVKELEERMKNLEDQLSKIADALGDLEKKE